MELRLLTTFLKVAQLQSFSKAAESLGYSQSAVTVQVQQLENELGVRLFDRIGKTVSITHYGQEFIPYARDVVSAAARAVSFTVEERDLTGTLRIGTIESIMTASFGEILPLYHERCPHVNTQLIESDTKTLSDMLMHNEVDLIYTLDDMGYDAQRIKLFECPQDIVIVASPKHRFASAKQLKLAELVDEPFVLMPQTNSYRHQFDVELAHQKLTIRPFLELESTSMVMQLLERSPYLVRAAALHGAPPRGRGKACHPAGHGLPHGAVEPAGTSPRQGAHAADPRHGRVYRAGGKDPAASRKLKTAQRKNLPPSCDGGRFASVNKNLVGHVRQEGDLTRSLDGLGELALVHRAGTGRAARQDLAALGQEAAKLRGVFVVDISALVNTELANFSAFAVLALISVKSQDCNPPLSKSERQVAVIVVQLGKRAAALGDIVISAIAAAVSRCRCARRCRARRVAAVAALALTEVDIGPPRPPRCGACRLHGRSNRRICRRPLTTAMLPLVKYLETNSAVLLHATMSMKSVCRSPPSRPPKSRSTASENDATGIWDWV